MKGLQIAKKIKSICHQKNIPINKLLEECSLNKGFIYDLEKRNISPSCDKILRLSDYLEISVDYLLGRTENFTINQLNNMICSNDNAVENMKISINGVEYRLIPVEKN